MVQARKRSEKINEYQAYEAGDIAEHLREGLSKGILNFDFTPNPHDDDTAESAAAYKQIGDTMSHAVSFIKGYVDEISHLLQEFSNENFDVTIKQNYLGDFGTIRQSLDGMIRSIGTLVSEIQTATSQVETGAEQISSSTQKMMSSFEEQSAVMGEMRNAVNVLTEKTQKNANDLKSAGELTIQVQNAAQLSEEQADEIIRIQNSMEAIYQSATDNTSSVQDNASVSEELSSQANMLMSLVERFRIGSR